MTREPLSCAQRKALLQLAREAVRARLEQREPRIPREARIMLSRSVFVTIKEHGELRGCIGSFTEKHLWEQVMEQALAAAFQDPRFPPLTREELARVTFEISILSPLEAQGGDWYERLTPGRHGLLLDWGFTRAVFLPSVWRELPGKERFVEALSMKAGLPPGAWRSARAFFFTVDEFSEDHPCPEEEESSQSGEERREKEDSQEKADHPSGERGE